MKKAIKTMLGLAAMLSVCAGLTACSEEVAPPQSPVREGLVDVVLSTSIPAEIQTYAEATASTKDSKNSGLANLDGTSGLLVRYVMEAYATHGSAVEDKPVCRQILYKPLSGEDCKKADFNVRLIATQYKFVFWADIVRPYNDNGVQTHRNRYFYTYEENGKQVMLQRNDDYNQNGTEVNLTNIVATRDNMLGVDLVSNESFDAFTTSGNVDLRTETSQSFELKRPFVKVRIVTTDVNEVEAQCPNIVWGQTVLSVTNKLPRQFNAVTGAFSATENETGWWSDSNYLKAYDAGEYDGPESEGTKTLGVFYLPTMASAQDFNFNISLKSNSGNIQTSTIASQIPWSVPNVPLVANKLITIKGNLLTKNATPTVTIEDAFSEGEKVIDATKEYSSVSDLMSNVSGESETIAYTGKVSKADGFTLNFDEVTGPATYADEEAEVTYRYADGNAAELTLKFASLEEGAVLTFTGAHAPSVLRITTDTKCSLRIDMSKTKICYDGMTYKYIITNAAFKSKNNGATYDALFLAGGAGFMSADDESHYFKINADFTPSNNSFCMYDEDHSTGTCNFIDTVRNWLTENNKTSVWDFVGDPKN